MKKKAEGPTTGSHGALVFANGTVSMGALLKGDNKDLQGLDLKEHMQWEYNILLPGLGSLSIWWRFGVRNNMSTPQIAAAPANALIRTIFDSLDIAKMALTHTGLSTAIQATIHDPLDAVCKAVTDLDMDLAVAETKKVTNCC